MANTEIGYTTTRSPNTHQEASAGKLGAPSSQTLGVLLMLLVMAFTVAAAVLWWNAL